MPPAGFKRSRALWDEARRPKDQKSEEWKSLARAILYELQPIRFSQYSNSLSPSSLVTFFKTRVIPAVRQFAAFVSGTLLPQLWSLLCNMTLRHWMIVGGVFLYYLAIRWIHEMLNAGPLVLIITALVAIFTVGLGDNADGELSAYSAFNRGFQRLMGSVDVENLINQHVGGGMMMAGAGGGMMMPPEPNINNNNQRRNNRPPRNQAPQENGAEDDLGDDNNDSDSDDDDDDQNGNNEQPQQQYRRAGKKSRRRNLEDRQEQRRQREVARAMGFDGTGGQEEVMAMQRLIEEQAAAAGGN